MRHVHNTLRTKLFIELYVQYQSVLIVKRSDSAVGRVFYNLFVIFVIIKIRKMHYGVDCVVGRGVGRDARFGE